MKSLGIDLGGTSAKIGVVEDGVILETVSVPTRADSDYEGIVHDLTEASKKLAAGHSVRKVGIGSPGLIDSVTGKVCYSNNIQWSDAPLRDDIGRNLGLPAWIANDAKCAALGEALYGAGKGCSRVAMLTLGTGVGGGFVAVSLVLFAFSTLLGWSYYGQRAVEYLFGARAVPVYKALFVAAAAVGCTMRLDLAWALSDTFNGLMALPNLVGVLALRREVLREWRRYRRADHI